MNIPDTALFYVVECDTTIRDLIEALYGHPTLETINHLLRINPHLRGDWVRAGQMFIVTPATSKTLAMLEQQMAIAARHLDEELEKLTGREREILARHYALLSNLAVYQTARYGWGMTRFHRHKTNLETQVHGLLAMPASFDQADDAACRRQQTLMQVHQSVCGMLSSRLFVEGSKVAALKAEAGVLRGAEVHQWKTQVGPAKTIASFKTHLNHIIRRAKNFAHHGSLAIALGCAASGTRQLALFGHGSAVPRDLSPSADFDSVHLLIGLEAGCAELLRCSVHNGSNEEPVFNRCYQKSPSWFEARLASLPGSSA